MLASSSFMFILPIPISSFLSVSFFNKSFSWHTIDKQNNQVPPVILLIHQNLSSFLIAMENCLNEGTRDPASKASLLGITAVAGEVKSGLGKRGNHFLCGRTHSEWCIAARHNERVKYIEKVKKKLLSFIFQVFFTILCQLPPSTACIVNNFMFSCSCCTRT